MADGHDAWYRRELDRGRRFHGAFAGGFSAGYHNTVGSAEGWQPASFRSSRTKRQRVAGARPEEIGDAEDGLLGRTVAVGAGYGSRAGDAAGPATAGARAPSEAPHRHGARLVRLLRRRRKRRRYATGAGEEDEEDRAPLSRAAAVPMLDGARFCVGYDGALERSSSARAGRDVYRVDDVLGGAGGGRATRTPALRDAGGAAPRGHHPWSRRVVITRGLGAFVDAAPPRRLCAARRRGRRLRGRRRAIRANGVRRGGRRRRRPSRAASRRNASARRRRPPTRRGHAAPGHARWILARGRGAAAAAASRASEATAGMAGRPRLPNSAARVALARRAQ